MAKKPQSQELGVLSLADFKVYAELKEQNQHVFGHYNRSGKCVIPHCVRTLKIKLAIRRNKTVAFGYTRINKLNVELVKREGESFWHLNRILKKSALVPKVPKLSPPRTKKRPCRSRPKNRPKP